MLWLPDGSEPSSLDLSAARRTLFEAREARVRPGTDDKVLTAWNAMAITALAEAGRAFEEPRFIDAAEGCARFVLKNLRRADGRLLRSWREGIPGRAGFCDDHALLASACLTLFSTTGGIHWFREAVVLLDALVDLFLDAERGGFFQTGSDDDQLVLRPKELYDNAVPSGNSVAADVLQRVALLSGDPDREQVGVAAIQLVRDALGEGADGVRARSLCARPLSRTLARGGDHRGPRRHTHACADGRSPSQSLPSQCGRGDRGPPPDTGRPWKRWRSSATAPQVEDAPTAYVCQRFACRLPVTRPEELAAQLEQKL